MNNQNTEPAIILDPGSGTIKFGISYWDTNCDQKIYQNMSIPALYGTSRYRSNLFRKRSINQGTYKRDYVIGKHVHMLFDLLDVTFPVRRGIVTDWDVVMKILHDGLQSFPNTVEIPKSILVSEPWFQPRYKREKMVEIIFEKYSYENFFSVPQGVLTLFNYNQKSGYVIESGAEQTQFVPIFNGHKIQHDCFNFNKGGFDVSKEILTLKLDSDHFQLNQIEDMLPDRKNLNPYRHFYELEALKKKTDISELYDKVFFGKKKFNEIYNEKYNKVIQNDAQTDSSDEFSQDLQIESSNSSVLQTRQSEMLQKSPNKLISNENNNDNNDGNNNNSVDLISKIKKQIGKGSLIPKEIYFGGGNFACKYFRERIEHELKDDVRTHTLPDDEFVWSTWKGGNRFVNLPNMKDFWIPINEYYEVGTNIINFSCL